MNIEERLQDEKWEKIRHFLMNKGIAYMEDLSESNIQEIYFVPGISYELIEELKRELLQNGNFTNSEEARREIEEYRTEQTEKEKHSINDKEKSEQDIKSSLVDYDIVDIEFIEQKVPGATKRVYWFYTLPWEVIVEGLKIKNTLADIIHARGLHTILDIMRALPLSLSPNEKGVKLDAVLEYNRYVEKKIEELSRLNSLSEAQDAGIVSRFTWENYYSKIDLLTFVAQLPQPLMCQDLLSILDMSDIEYNTRISKRIHGETLEYFLLERGNYELKGIGKLYMNNFLTQLFHYLATFVSDTVSEENYAQIEFEETFPPHIETLKMDQLDVLLDDADYLKMKQVAKKYSLKTLKEFTGQVFELEDYFSIREIVKELQQDHLANFQETISSFSEERYNLVLGRSLGETLETLGNDIGVTRERARQILKKFSIRTLETVEKLANIVECGRGYFSKNDWSTLIEDEETMLIIDWVLRDKSEKYEYLWYTGQYVRSTFLTSGWQIKLKDIIETNSANIGDVHELFEQSIHEIQKLNIQFVDEEKFISILTSLVGYKVNHGAYIKRGVNNSEILATVIEENFPFDIKLDSNEDNEELNRLKLIMRAQYPGIKIPDKNHNLTSIIVKSKRIVLSGRGRYVVASRIYFPEHLKKEIYSWIMGQNTTIMYNEVFEKFKGRLIFESNINNSNFLHGVLQYYYEDEFNFKRDSFSPVGQKIVRTDDRVHDLIHEHKILNIKEIQQMIPGLKDYQIFAILERSEELFNAGKNRISSTESINFTDAQEELLHHLLHSELEENYGFTSSKVFFKRLQGVGLIDGNGVLNEVGMFQYIKVKAKGKLKMRYPYIFKNGVHADEENITFTTVIGHFFIEGKDVINRSQIENFSRKYGLSDISIYSFFQENSEKLLRLSKNIYVPRTRSSISDEMFVDIDSYLSETVHDFLPIIDFRDYASLPNAGYEWNEFMLEDVVDKFGIRVRLIDRLVNFSHHISSIIVPADSKLQSYEDVVVSVMEKNGKKLLNEREMLALLQSNGLTSVAIPLELSDGEHLWFNPRSDQYQIR